MASNDGGGGGKEERRRRRIAERGSDRMALITGRINALPPSPRRRARESGGTKKLQLQLKQKLLRSTIYSD